jgi:hypothetical protein
MNTIQELIDRLEQLKELRGSDCKVIVKSGNSELEIDGIRSDTSTGKSIVIINVIG